MLLKIVLWVLVFLLGAVVAVLSKPLWDYQSSVEVYFRAGSAERGCDYKFEFAETSRWSGQYGHGGSKIACGEVQDLPAGVTIACVCDQEGPDSGSR